MGGQVIRQPNGLFARYSSSVDGFTHVQLTEEQYVEYCVEQATERARQDARAALELAKEYGSSAARPFAVSWSEAVAKHLKSAAAREDPVQQEQRVFEAIDADLPHEKILELCAAAGWKV